MNQEQLSILLPEIRRIAVGAGEKIMEIYKSGFDTETKSDDSPVTSADLAANKFIDEELKKLDLQFPILSEESAHLPFEERASRDTYWLVDPLDGTKEFINRRDSFTVNIALIDQHKPILGVVYAPALGLSYFAGKGLGSFKTSDESSTEPEAIHSRDVPDTAIFVGSRSHTGEDMVKFLENYEADNGQYDLQSMGSSLKMCMVAEGNADLYPRLWLTSEWDTAAAHCILNEAGGKIVNIDMSPLLYNTKDSLLNPYFFAIGNNSVAWNKYLPKSLIDS
ncbi:3'(2'),5'-bisphosphate nucleotidase CysQ [Cocleimonas flava]|uniref:3'(2'),5'-bisphosphate nucleotidase CysQ n=1 Tax=Cocleimonas flava TaxID=634765 RepID=A0A4R1F3S9_9GAMM|nr:3'(2'),5'-bisphosphate nucleotidase CysQ [Cocleimonas flava]TCJ88917.1 3'(2'),5'-bisphosphate nucleotidase [Cocleimonas flava]